MQKGKPKKDKKSKKVLDKSSAKPIDYQNDDFDFGGFPKDRDLKKNMGCGG